MESAPIVRLPDRRARARPSRRTSAQQPRRTRGRAWINGHEIGRPDPRFAHLGDSYD